MEGLIFEASTDPAITGLTVDAQFTGDNLYDAIKSYAILRILVSESNYLMITNSSLNSTPAQTVPTISLLIPMSFSLPKFENVINTNYLESKKTLKTVTLVAGEGEGLIGELRPWLARPELEQV